MRRIPTTRPRPAVLSVLAACLLAACSAAATPATPAGAATPATPATTPLGSAPATLAPEPTPAGSPRPLPTALVLPRKVPDETPGVTGEVPAAMIEKAREALRELTGDAADRATLVTAVAVTWPNGALGCPERGMFYTQALVPGFQVVFDLDGTTYDYRMSSGGSVRRCEAPHPLGS